MRIIGAALLVVLLAGCSSTGMRTGGSSVGGMGASSGPGGTWPSDFRRQPGGGTVIDSRTGGLTPYHGG